MFERFFSHTEVPHGSRQDNKEMEKEKSGGSGQDDARKSPA